MKTQLETLRDNESFAEIMPLAMLGRLCPRFTLSCLLNTSEATVSLTLLNGSCWSLRASLYGREYLKDSGADLGQLMQRALNFGELVSELGGLKGVR